MENMILGLYVSYHLIVHYVFEVLVIFTKVVIHCFYQFNELLDHIKFDHGYTASSPPVVNVSVITSFIY